MPAGAGQRAVGDHRCAAAGRQVVELGELGPIEIGADDDDDRRFPRLLAAAGAQREGAGECTGHELAARRVDQAVRELDRLARGGGGVYAALLGEAVAVDAARHEVDDIGKWRQREGGDEGAGDGSDDGRRTVEHDGAGCLEVDVHLVGTGATEEDQCRAGRRHTARRGGEHRERCRGREHEAAGIGPDRPWRRRRSGEGGREPHLDLAAGPADDELGSPGGRIDPSGEGAQ